MTKQKCAFSKPKLLNEKEWRLFLACQAEMNDSKGIQSVSDEYRVSEKTIRKGIFELNGNFEGIPPNSKRIRRKGGGRKALVNEYPDLEKLIARFAEKMGTPNLRQISEGLQDIYNIKVSPSSLSRIIRKKKLNHIFRGSRKSKRKTETRKPNTRYDTARKQEILLQTLEKGFQKRCCDTNWILGQVAKTLGISKKPELLSKSENLSDRAVYRQLIRKSIEALAASGREQTENSFLSALIPGYKEMLFQFFPNGK